MVRSLANRTFQLRFNAQAWAQSVLREKEQLGLEKAEDAAALRELQVEAYVDPYIRFSK